MVATNRHRAGHAAAASETSTSPSTAPAVSGTPTPTSTSGPATATAPPRVGGIDPVPGGSPETPPSGWTESGVQLGRGQSPPKVQLASATNASEEVRASTTFAARFGADVSQGSVADALALVGAWFIWREAARLWLTYTKDQFTRAWIHSAQVLGPMQQIFTGAAAVNPHVVEEFPALAQFLGARTAMARRAANTKARNRKSKAKEAASTSAPVTPVSTPAATTATTPTAAAPVAPPKSVT